jgi:ADP-dependent NAD(P)H-hydrate dehydratase
VMERAGRSKAVLIGPGMTDPVAGCRLSASLLAEVQGPAYVLDAGAMRGIMENRDVMRRHAGRIVITPHAGEMAALLDVSKDEVLADPLAAARKAASQLQVVVAMKGGCTRIVTPQGDAWACSQGNVGLATSGSGDVLAGIIAGLLARGAAPAQATIWGVFTHGDAGRRMASKRGPVGYLARELLDDIPAILAQTAGQMEPPP